MPKKTRILALKIAHTHVFRNRGVTRQDLSRWYGWNDNYARRRLFTLVKSGLIRHIVGRKSGRFKQYFLTNSLDRFVSQEERAYPKGDQTDPSFITRLASLLLSRKPTFHKLVFQTEIPAVLYESLDWDSSGGVDHVKVREYKFGFRQNIKFIVYSKGKVFVDISSSQNPFELHQATGIIDLIGALGHADCLLKLACKSASSVPPIRTWKLRLYDRDKTVLKKELEDGVSDAISWWSEDGIRVEHLGEIFQIYGKNMPLNGQTVRFENQKVVDENVPLEQALFQAISPELKITTAFEEFKKDMNNRLLDIERRIEKSENPTALENANASDDVVTTG